MKWLLMVIGEDNVEERTNSSAFTHDGSSQVDFEVIESVGASSEPRRTPRLPFIMLDSYDGNRAFMGQQDIYCKIVIRSLAYLRSAISFSISFTIPAPSTPNPWPLPCGALCI